MRNAVSTPTTTRAATRGSVWPTSPTWTLTVNRDSTSRRACASTGSGAVSSTRSRCACISVKNTVCVVWSTLFSLTASVQSFKRLVLHAGGQDFQDALTRTNWTLFRNQLTANLALSMGGYATRSQPALLFINGELWGIYQIRERPDAWFLDDHYGIQAADFCTEPNHPWTRDVIAGDLEHWEHLLGFLETHDLADDEHYAYVASQVDIANFIDYNLLQIYTANDDWPQNNVHQFRPRTQGGRWHWMFWDSDHGIGGNRGSDFNMLTWALDRQFPLGTERDILLLQKLLDNATFPPAILLPRRRFAQHDPFAIGRDRRNRRDGC